jgi:hypothetical protein
LGDGRHRHLLMSVFYASYTSDLIQIWRRPSEFTKTFAKFMVPHHILSFAWFTPWMVFMAPRGAEGAPIWNTVRRAPGGGLSGARARARFGARATAASRAVFK